MRDTELLLRYFSFRNYLSIYSGTLKNFLDDACKNLNSEWDEKRELIEAQLASFEAAHKCITSIFKGNQYKKWNGDKYESRFNRAVFDVFVLSFDDENVRALSEGKETEIENAFKLLCSEDREFLTSIESTTKSLNATHTRLATWFYKLNDVLGTKIHVPKLIDNRIV